MKKPMCDALVYFAKKDDALAKPRPTGCGAVGLTNLLSQKLIERFGRDGTTGEQLYRITEDGRAAVISN